MLHPTLRSFASTVAGLIALMTSPPSIAGFVTIDFDLAALAMPGRYEYRYTLTNVSLAAPLSWFSVDFDTALYDESSLAITSVGLGDWSEQLLASVSVLGVPAQYDSYKTSGASLGIGDTQTGFAVEFTWLGVGRPGSQAFTIYDPATLNVLDSGLTTAVGAPPPPNGAPEPSTAALVLLALCGAAAGRRHSVRDAGSLMSAPRPAGAGLPPRGSRKVAEPHFLESAVRTV